MHEFLLGHQLGGDLSAHSTRALFRTPRGEEGESWAAVSDCCEVENVLQLDLSAGGATDGEPPLTSGDSGDIGRTSDSYLALEGSLCHFLSSRGRLCGSTMIITCPDSSLVIITHAGCRHSYTVTWLFGPVHWRDPSRHGRSQGRRYEASLWCHKAALWRQVALIGRRFLGDALWWRHGWEAGPVHLSDSRHDLQQNRKTKR